MPSSFGIAAIPSGAVRIHRIRVARAGRQGESMESERQAAFDRYQFAFSTPALPLGKRTKPQ